MGADAAHALPTGGQVTGGKASITSRTGRTTVNQSSQRAIIDWSSFNVSQGQTVQFNQPNASAITLNRINDVNPSFIDGTITASGQVWLINPQGIAFGKNAQVNVGGLLATTSDIDNAAFMAGNYSFSHPGNATATISNAGSLAAVSGGLVALAGPNVSNSGIITAKLGKVQLASGDMFTVDLYGDGLINLQASPAITQQLAANSGVIQADGGQVLLTAAAAETVVNSLINMSGVIDADTVGTQQGQATITALGSNAVANNVAANKGQLQGDSEVLVSGSISASGKGSGQTGGAITVTADNVGILSGGVIDASGDAGGGTVRIGGDFHGQGTTPTALHTIVESGATIAASAITTGNGGQVAVWSDQQTDFAGSILARGGSLSGNGGYVETSGHDLDATGTVDASAPHGNAGTWLLDPTNIDIEQSSCTGAGCASANSISTSLSGGTSVTITTTTGSITLGSSATATITDSGSSNATLDFEAGTDIVMANSSAITASGTGKLNVTFDADTAAGGGAISLGSGSSITTNGGNIIMGGQGVPLTAAAVGDSTYNAGINLNDAQLLAGGGNITLTGTGYAGGSGNSFGGVTIVSGSQVETTGTGTITVTGTVPSNSNEEGIWVYNSSTILSTVDGNLSLNGTAYTTSGGWNSGIYIRGGTIEATGLGNVNLSATAGPNSGGNNSGIFLDNGGEVISAVNGNIVITGTGAGTGSNDYGVQLHDNSTNGIYTTGTGNITLTGIGANGAAGIWTGSSGTSIGGSSDEGNIKFVTDSISISGTTITTASSGSVTFQPYTPSNSIGFSGGAGNLAITQAILDSVNSPTVTIGSLTGTGTITTSAFNWEHTLNNLTLEEGGSAGAFTIGGNITKGVDDGSVANSATGNLTVISGSDIVQNANTTISSSSTYGALNVTYDSAYVASGNGTAGAIVMNSGSAIDSNGGNITLGGGSNPLTDAAMGDAMYNAGFKLNTGTLSAAGGNISLIGTAYASSTTEEGLDIGNNGNGSIQTTGNGSISLIGVGPNTSGGTAGVWSNATLSTVNGAINITGTGGGTGTTQNSYGVVLGSGNTLQSTGAGSIVVNGTGGSGSGGSNYGIWLKSTSNPLSVTSVNGNITFTGVSNNGGTGILANGGNAITIGSSTDNGIIAFIADTISLANETITTGSSGSVTFAPYTAGTSIGFSGGNGTLQVTQAIMDEANAPSVIVGSLTGTGLITTGAFNWEHTLNNLTLEEGGSAGAVTIGGNITKGVDDGSVANSATGNLTVISGSDIVQNANTTISSSSSYGALNVLYDSDYAGNGGAIAIGGSSATSGGITSNGGNIVLGGGNSTITAGNGYAVGDSTLTFADGYESDNDGITIENALLSSGAGNMIVNGHGYSAGSDYAAGILLIAHSGQSATLLSTAGNITINGIGGGGSAGYDTGISLAVSASITSGSGNISVTGVGGSNSAGNNQGVRLYGPSTIGSTGSSTITITGIAGTGGSNDYGIYTITGGNTFGGSSATGNLTLQADTLYLAGSLNIQTSGNITIEPYTASTTIGVNGGAGTLGVSSTYLGEISGESSLTIGNSADTGAMTLGAYASWNAPVTFLTGSSGSISVTGDQTATGSGAFTFTGGPVSLAGNLSTAGGNITMNPAVTLGQTDTISAGTGEITAGSTVNAGSYNLTLTADDISLGGTVNGTGTLTLQPYTSTLSEAIGQGATGTWSLGNGTIADIGTGWATVNIGNANLTGAAQIGNVTMPTLMTSGATYNIYGGNMTFVGNSIIYNNANYYAETGDLDINSAQSWNATQSNTVSYYSAGNTAITNAISVGYNGGGTNLSFYDNLGGTGNLTVAANLGGGYINALLMIAQNNLTVNSGVTIQNTCGCNTTLEAADGNVNGTGLLTLNGTIYKDYAGFTLISGLNGSVRANLTLNSSNFIYGASNGHFGYLTLIGFNNVIFNEAIKPNGASVAAYGTLTINDPLQKQSTSSVTLSATNGIDLNADLSNLDSGNSTGSWGLTGPVIASGSRTISTSATGGAITINGTIDGTTSGSDSLTLNSGTSATTISGIVGGTTPLGNLTITADNLSLGGTVNGTGTLTLQPYTNTLSEAIGQGASGTWSLGNATIADIGTGWATVNIGNANLSGAAQLGNITFPTLTTSGATYNIYGGNMTFVGNSVIYNNANYYAETGDLDIDSAQSWTTANLASAPNAKYYSAGNISIGSPVTLINGGGNGYENLYFYDDLSSTGNITVNANVQSSNGLLLLAANNITVNSGSNLTASGSGWLQVEAANNNASNTGILQLNGVLQMNYGFLNLLSGTNGSGGRNDLTFNSSNFSYDAGGLVGGAFVVNGFGNVTLDEAIKANYVRVTAFGNLTINSALQNSSVYSSFLTAANGIYLNANISNFDTGGSQGAWAFNSPVIVSGSRTISTSGTGTGGYVTFSSTIDGTTSGNDSLTLNSGTATTTVTGAVGSMTPLGNLTITADSLSLGGTVYGTGTLTLSPYSAGTVMHVNDGASSGWYLNSTELGYIQPDWASVVLGSTSNTGGMTAGANTWSNALTLETGGNLTTTGNQGMGTNSLTLVTGGNLTLGGNLTSSGTGTLTIEPVTASTSIGVNGGAGNLAVTSTDLSYIASQGWSNVTIGSSGGTGTITLPATSFAGMGNLTFMEGGGSISVTGTQTGTGTTAFAFSGPTTLSYAGTDATTANGTITFSSPVTLSANATLSSGSAAMTFGSTVNGGNNLTATAGSFSLGGAWGGTMPLAAVSLTSASDLTLPAISAASIFAETTGASATLTLSGQLAASGSGTPVVLVTQANFINTAGPSAIGLTGSGSPRWLIYSDSETPDGLTPASTVYNQTYASDPPGSVTQSGNTWIYAQYLGTLDVSANAQNITYGQAIPTFTYSCTGGGCGGLTGALTSAAGNAGALPNAGSYGITQGTLAENGYQIDFTGNTLTVGKAALTFTASNVTMTYADGTTLNETSGFTASGLQNSETVGSVTLSANATTSGSGNWNAGSWAITPSAATGGSFNPANYTITYDAGTLTVSPKSVSIAGVSATGKTYDGTTADTLNTGSASITGKVGGDNVSIITGTGTFFTANVSTNITVSATGFGLTGADAGDYSLSGQPSGLMASISQAMLTVTANSGQGKIYGAADPALTYSYSGLVGGDTSSVITGSLSREPGQNAGTYAITQGTLSAGANYAISFNAADFNINPATLTVTATDLSKVYGASMPALTYSYSGLAGGDTASVFSGSLDTAAAASSNVGSYAITQGSLSAGTNYAISYNPGTLTITPAALTIAADNKSKIYGAPTPTLTATFSGLVYGDTAAAVSGLTLSVAGSNVGSYAIVPSGATAANYAITYVDGRLTINPATLIVSADDRSRAFGAGNPLLTFSYSGLENGDTASVFAGALTTSATLQSEVGNYAIGQGTLSAGANYLIDYIPGTLTVISPIPTSAVQMPSIVSTLGQSNNFIDPSLNMDRGGAPLAIYYLGNTIPFAIAAPSAGNQTHAASDFPSRFALTASALVNCDGDDAQGMGALCGEALSTATAGTR